MRVAVDAGAVHVEVVNGAGRPAVPTRHDRGRGAGLPGMRERAAVHGGCVDAGPTPDGGFAVRAALPLAPAGRSGVPV
ncbi:hypothetical protein DQ238_15165 [Geodermatophilus sp. TF02-6]|nr:hypothetical protein DQ238_15165 [Geodermatophilus sp. TF02-6]